MRSPFTAKGFIVGTVFSVAVSLCAPYVVFVLQASAMGINSSSPGAIFFFFLLVFAVNTLLGMIGRCFCLGRGDLVLVYAMLMVAVTAPTYNFRRSSTCTKACPAARRSPGEPGSSRSATGSPSTSP